MKVSFANAAMAQNVSQKCEDRKRLLKAKIKNAESITNEIDRASAVELYKDLTKCNHSLLSHCQNTKFVRKLFFAVFVVRTNPFCMQLTQDVIFISNFTGFGTNLRSSRGYRDSTYR